MATARAAALHALVALEKGRAERLRPVLDGFRLVGREQALAYELAHGVVRRERLLEFVLAPLAHRGLPKDPALRCALRLGAYQLLFVRGMPARAAVHETVMLVRSNKGFANAILRRLAERVDLRSAQPEPVAAGTELPLGERLTLALPQPLPQDAAQRLAIVHSLPDFLVQRWAAVLSSEELAQVAAAASAVPAVFLRAAGAATRESLAAELRDEGVECTPAAHPRLLRWTGGGSPFVTRAFAAGRFVVQDPTALAAAEAVPCAAGDTVVDLCAAPGTKTTVLAERVQPGGAVVAFDVDAARRERIAENVRRLRLEAVAQIAADPAALPRAAAAALADVPCSNTGVLGRRVEVRRRLRPETFAELAAVQRTLLARAIELCRPGGSVVYSTCSIEREENEDVVAAVLGPAGAAGARCGEVVRTERTLPLAGERDGGFFAVLRTRA